MWSFLESLGGEDVGYLFAVVTTVKICLAALGEAYDSFDKGEDRMVLTESDVASGEDFGASLAHNNRTGLSLLAVIELRSQVFWV